MKTVLVALPSGKQIVLEKERTLIGRNQNCDVIAPDDYVSNEHCTIVKKGSRYIIEDLASSNGTFINGKRIDGSVSLRNNDTVSLGQKARAYQFRSYSELIRKTTGFFSDPKKIIPAAGGLLAALVAAAVVLITSNAGRIDVEKGLANLKTAYGESIVPPDETFLTVVQNAVDAVRREGSYFDTLQRRQNYIELIESTLERNKLPSDFSFIPWVESHYYPSAYNYSSQAAGMWQLVPGTARQYGLVVGAGLDERFDPAKSAAAASLYLKNLVSIFGRDSFLLVLAAYNAGDNVVLYALKQIQDPVKDRNFWYLYKNNLIPEETKQYVLKILALIIMDNSQ